MVEQSVGERRAGVELAGRYHLEVVLGSGAWGEVWKAEDRLHDRPVAIKFLRSEVVISSPVLLRKFQQEARIGAVVGHPGIARVDDFGEYDGRWYLVMEFLRGGNLQEEIGDHPRGLPLPRLLSVGSQVADALSAAHARGIVHRDLKPANIMLTGPKLAPKICDFGIAHLAGASTINTLTGKSVGTPSYMAPEQWLGKPVDARSDLYALGGTLYTLLTGAPAFSGSLLALKAQHLDTPPVSPDTVRPGLPPGLGFLILQLLAKDPDDRPTSAGDVAERLLRLTEPTTTIERPHTETAQPPARTPVSAATTRSDPPEQNALERDREAVRIHRGAAEAEPGAHLLDLAASLNELGGHLSKVGDKQGASEATGEAVQICRGLAEADPVSNLPHLAWSLGALAFYLSELGDKQGALEANREAVQIRRGLAEAEPATYLSHLAWSVNHRGFYLEAVGDKLGALEASRETSEIYRQLAEAEPATYLSHLARSLHTLGDRLAVVGDQQAALEAIREAVQVRRGLV